MRYQIQGFSGCNSFSGGFELENDSIKLGPLTATQMGCIKKGEAFFYDQLKKTTRFQVRGDILKFLAGKKILLSFIKRGIK